MKEKIYLPAVVAALAMLALLALFCHLECHAHFEHGPGRPSDSACRHAPIVVTPAKPHGSDVIPPVPVTPDHIAPAPLPAPIPPAPIVVGPIVFPPPPAPKPIVAVIGAEWCGPCRRLEREVIPDLRGALDVILIDCDKQQDLMRTLINPRSNEIPQFVLCRYAANGTEILPVDWLSGRKATAASVEKWATAIRPDPQIKDPQIKDAKIKDPFSEATCAPPASAPANAPVSRFKLLRFQH